MEAIEAGHDREVAFDFAVPAWPFPKKRRIGKRRFPVI
jgi:hypothetical protein